MLIGLALHRSESIHLQRGGDKLLMNDLGAS